jgi:hypothetical protein
MATMELTNEQKQHLYQHGYVQVRGVVPQVMVEEALKAINHSLGEGMPPEKMTTFRAQSYCPELVHTPVIADLFNKTPALALAESAIGAGRFKRPTGGQIALRFPSFQDPPRPPRPHIDGMYSPTNGVQEGTIQNFTALGCILLSELNRDFAGNFTVWPGTHHAFETYFREQGPQALLNGMPPVEMPAPLQIHGKPGDFVLAHYLLGHAAAINVSPYVRYAIFFRITHLEHGDYKWETMTDAWRQWEGMGEIVAANRGAQ